MSIACPHCHKSLGGLATEGGLRLRLGIVLVDPTTGRVHGPCPACKGDVTVADSSQLTKALVSAVEPSSMRLGVRVRRVPVG